MKKRVLVTGACGFIGSHIINELKNFDVQIMGIDRILPKQSDDKVQYLTADLLDVSGLESLLKEFNPDSIIHLAAIAAPTYENTAELYNTNIKGSENLFDAAYKICNKRTRIVATSTAGVYGISNEDYISENSSYNPQNHYSFSKMVMEYIAKRYKDKLDMIIIRPFNILGMNQTNNFLIPKLVEAFISKQEVLRVGNLETARDYVDVEYTVKLFVKVALFEDINFDIINICAGHATKGIDIVNYLNEITGFMPKIEVAPEFLRANEIMRLVGDATICREIMKDIATVKPVKEILANMVKQYEERL